MKIYHGTSATNARKIMQTGLLPRSITGVKPTFKIHGVEHWSYLCDHPSYYAHKRSVLDNCAVAAIIEFNLGNLIEIKKSVDDDTCEQIGRTIDDFEEMTYIQRRTFYRCWAQTQTDISFFETYLRNGSFSILERIPPDFISRIAFMDLDYVKPFMKPPFSSRVSILNYRFIRNKYRALNEWIFDGKVKTKIKQWETFTVNYPVHHRNGIEILVPVIQEHPLAIEEEVEFITSL